MAFSFGAPAPAGAGAAPAPAAAAGGFSFGAPAPAPAAGAAPAPAAGGFSFGSPAPAAPGAPAKSPAPAGGGFGFGAPAPAPAAPAPAAGGFGFGAPAPAAPALAGGGLFGSTPAPAAGTSLFGAPAPAAGGGGLFGSTTPAPAPSAFGFGAPTPAPAPTAFGAPAPAAAAAGAASQQQYLTGHTPYSSLPPAAKKMVDDIHSLMMKHKKDLATVGSMAPALLHVPHGSAAMSVGAGIDAADMAGGSPARPRPAANTTSAATASRMSDIDPNRTPLPTQIDILSQAQRTAAVQLESCLSTATQLKSDAERLAVQGIQYGSWPVEALAARRNVQLSALSTDPPPISAPNGQPGTPSIKAPGQNRLESSLRTQLLDMAASHVDRIEHLPYLWEVLQELEGRAQQLANRIDALGRQLYTAELARDGGVGGVGGVGGGQYHGSGADGTAGSRMLPPLLGMAAMGRGDAASGTGLGGGIGSDLVVYNPNPAVAMAAATLGGHPQSYEEELAAVARQQAEAFLRVAAVVARSHDALDELRGRCRRVAAVRGAADPFELADRREAEEERKVQERIRSEVAVAAGKIGPGAGAGAAGAAPGTPGAAAPAPAAGGGLFGAPAPAPAMGGGLFGSTPAPAPATGGLFGAASLAPAPAGGGLFGATPAPAPAAGGGLFGAAPAAPAFGAAPAPATGTVRNKSKTRGTRRR